MRHASTFLMMVVLAGVAGCSQPPSPTPEQQAATQKAAAQKAAAEKLTMFHKLLGMQRQDLAVSIGQEIVTEYPHTKAATEVAKKLPGLKAKAHAKAEKYRLTNLWLYQVSPMAGGTQSTASIDPGKPSGSKVDLVLRRQSEWGTSAFLYDHRKGQSAGFVCRKLCDIVMHFDGKKHLYQGYLPKDGSPAMFIKNHEGFIKRMAKADKVEVTVTVKGKGRQMLVFETGGFDADKWEPLPEKSEE